MAAVDLPEVAGFEMLEGQMKLQKLNKKIVDAFVAEIVVYDRERIEIKWKFRDELLS
ncbi:cassette chromosome recombinase B [Eubacterium sp. CAG:603]|nr:cassette chromosome recombinase B [Eubacterium sp. CAG:603]